MTEKSILLQCTQVLLCMQLRFLFIAGLKAACGCAENSAGAAASGAAGSHDHDVRGLQSHH